MHWLARIVVVLALIEGGWLAFDGARAFVVGDYLTPSSGPYAGQLGPWSKLVEAVGIEPRSALMKSIHLGLGVAWLGAVAGYLRGARWGRRSLLTCAALGLWYLPFGTILSIAQIILLLLPPLRGRSTE